VNIILYRILLNKIGLYTYPSVSRMNLSAAECVYTLCSENTHLQFLSYLLFLRYIHCNFCLNLAINHVDYESVSWCFFLNTVYLASGWFAPQLCPWTPLEIFLFLEQTSLNVRNK